MLEISDNAPLLLQSLPVPVLLVGDDRLTVINKGAARLLEHLLDRSLDGRETLGLAEVVAAAPWLGEDLAGFFASHAEELFAERTLDLGGERHWYDVCYRRVAEAGAARVILMLQDITLQCREREAARHREEKLRAERDQAQRLIGSASVLVVGLDASDAIVLFNEEAEAVTGFRAEEVLGQDWFECVTPENRFPGRREVYRTLARSGGQSEVQEPLLTRSGEERIVAWRISPSHQDGRYVGALCVGRDVTDVLRARDELQKNVERSRVLLAQLPQRVFVKDAAGRFVMVNEAFAQDFGLSPEACAGKSDFDLFETALAEKYRADDFRIMETRQTETIIETNVSHGQERYVEVVKAPVITDSGEVIGVVGLFTDITERKRIEAALAYERDLLHTLMSCMPDQIYFKDRDGRFLRVNPATAAALGISDPNEAIGCTDADFYPPDLAEAYRADDLEVMRTGVPVIAKSELQRQSGERDRWISTTKVPIYDHSGQVIGLSGISRDITDRVEAEQQLQRTAAELARSNEELEQFAYVASHDLQEPLRMVASYTQLLARRYRDQLDDDARDFIDFAVDGAVRMQRLIHDLLAFSRVGTRGGEFVEVPLGQVVDQACRNLQAAIEESGAQISCDPLPTVCADASQLVQLVQNLIGNALKFRGEQVPEIHVSARREAEEWVFGVHDNGIGIEAPYLDRIFVIFQRLHGRGEYPGSGIGLAICKKIVNRHGGRIWVESTPGQGSSFYFSLPLACARIEPEAGE